MSGENGQTTQSRDVESAIIEELDRRGPRTLDELLQALPGYTWNQVFAAVDRMSRKARVRLQRPTRFEYQVSVASHSGSNPVHGR